MNGRGYKIPWFCVYVSFVQIGNVLRHKLQKSKEYFMKIERVDENTVKCFLSNDELQEMEITYKDFVTRSEKAKELVDRIIEQAAEEVGYKPPQFAFDMQIMVLPEKGMVLTFSEKTPDEVKNNPSLMKYLEEMKKILDGNPSLNSSVAKAGEPQPVPNIPVSVVFCFSSMIKLAAYARILPANLRIRTRLYKYNGYYYLFMNKGSASYERYSRACIHAMEYGGIFSAREESVDLLEEHGQIIIPEKVIQKLSKI